MEKRTRATAIYNLDKCLLKEAVGVKNFMLAISVVNDKF
jgi:hypothetical protein